MQLPALLYLLGSPDSSVGKESTCNAGDPDLTPGWGRSTGGGIHQSFQYSWTSLVAQLIKNLSAMQEAWVLYLGWEDQMEKGKVTRSSILAWEDLGSIPELGRSPREGKGYPFQYSGLENSMDCIVYGITKSRTWLSNFHFNFTFI